MKKIIKIKKLILNKEIVSILGRNDMNIVKGGVGYANATLAAEHTCVYEYCVTVTAN